MEPARYELCDRDRRVDPMEMQRLDREIDAARRAGDRKKKKAKKFE